MNDVLDEQLAYYRARAQEYDQSLQAEGGTVQPEEEGAKQEWTEISKALHALAPTGDVLELACGTGIWTQELAKISRSITAIDGSPEMIELNRTKLKDAAIEYQCVDLFQWEPKKQYDLVFFAFWLSHVPPSHISSFLEEVVCATKPGGRVFMVDEPRSESNISGPNREGLYQQRRLRDGSSFRIVKVYYDPGVIEQELIKHDFQKESAMIGGSFFYLCASRMFEAENR
jgi:demethylmenaquinone methyltransferase/2-methoxy-6-polyprenyl-1,4-benzoquinol methylase